MVPLSWESVIPSGILTAKKVKKEFCLKGKT